MRAKDTLIPLAIKLSAPGGVAVRWNDGHAATYPYAYLRRRCPCAICRDTPPVVKTEPDPFPMLGKGPIATTGATPIGRYAIQFHWNDGHAEGIYSYSYLRGICPCEDCRGSEVP
jgi:DUF971 family protein